MELSRESTAQFYLYPTMECSLSCHHCFIHEEIRKSKMSMTVEQCKHVVDEYAKYFHSVPDAGAEITIMGGEPSLLKPSFYEEVIPYIREKFNRNGKQGYITLMTNFLHVPALEKTHHLFDFISTSFEPNRFTSYNKSTNLDKKYETWEKNLKGWIDAGRIVTLSFTTTEDVINEGVALFDRFFELGVRYFQINKAYPEGEYLKNIMTEEQAKEHAQFRNDERYKPVRNRKVIKVYDSNQLFADFEKETQFLIDATKWMTEKINAGVFVSVDPLSRYPEGIRKNHELDDEACGARKGFSVRGDGCVTGCASEIGNKDILSWGNIWEQDLAEIAESKERKDFLNLQKRVSAKCIRCEYYTQCKGGCIIRSRLWDHTKDGECHSNKGYLKWVDENIDELLIVMEKVEELRDDY
ncbi:SPASM domain-containing protein [Vibrio owensii]|uniref:SPASM domain-containing protein n=1 Tax=Vibrio harveyi group TaxID=717610 RepID=UPI003CC62062